MQSWKGGELEGERLCRGEIVAGIIHHIANADKQEEEDRGCKDRTLSVYSE